MPRLTETAFSVAGEWSGPSASRPRDPWVWDGAIVADQPITALSILSRGSDISWGRARRVGTCRLPAKLRIGTEPGRGQYVNWAIGSFDEGSRRAWFSLDVPLGSLTFWSGGVTGVLSWLLDLGGEPRIRVGGILVAEIDTRGGRNGIWHLADGLEAEDEVWTQALRRSGTGKVLGKF